MKKIPLQGLTLILLTIIPITLINGACEKPLNKLQKIKKSGELHLLTRNNANCYYIYRDEPMGFEYDLVKAFSNYLDVDLKVHTSNWNHMFENLYKNKGDLLAAGITINREREKIADFSDSYMEIQQQVVVNRSNRKIQEISDLSGRKVHVREGTTYRNRLKELNGQNDLGIEIVLHKDKPTEELIRGVARDQIDITIADSNIALMNRRYYPDIRIAFPIAEPQALGWAVKKGDNELLEEINTFLAKIKENGKYEEIYERYYGNVHIFDYVDLIKFHRRLESRLPRYKEIIKDQAERHGFDWRLIAAMIYQESHFNPRAVSFTDVKGLMQVTLTTAREMGINNRLDPEQSVKAGVSYLRKLYQRWDKIEGQDRLLYALASYNIGYGHVSDACKIAERQGLPPDRWASLEETLPLLRIKKHYKNTTYGYTRGTEPVRYVNRIMNYYDILKKKKDIRASS
ncbi:MAG: membrane-bound lytic murein transglycosylase MltF [Desulfurivibrionaceae bacterium]